MTYNALMELGETLFDEYLPKVKRADRKQFLEELFGELSSCDALTIEDTEDREIEDEDFEEWSDY
jgi:hypothetical protein